MYKSSTISLLVTYLLTSPFLFQPVFAQEKLGSITGKITTSDGIAAVSATVKMLGFNRTTVSGQDGSFLISNLQPGVYLLRASYLGFESQEKQVTIAENETAVVTFTLLVNSEKLGEVRVSGVGNNHKAVSIGKAGISPMDMPQSTSIVSSQVIADQQSSRLSDVMKNVNGVAMGSSRGSTSENFFARGYSLGSNNYFKNGARYNSGSIPEVSTLERVEVLKGSAAMLFGNVSGGAIVNLVTKKPKFEYGGELALRTGSYDHYKPTGDVYGPITENLAFRLIGTYENSRSYRETVNSEKYYFNPSFLYNMGENTTLLVEGDYLNYDLTPDFGIGSLEGKIPTRIDRGSFFNTPWAYNKANQTTASATLDHQLNSQWKIQVIGSFQQFEREYYSAERIQADAVGDWNRTLNRLHTAENYFTAQLHATGKFQTGSIGHSLLLGTDADRYINTSHTFDLNKDYDTINLLDGRKYTSRTDMPAAVDSLRSEAPTHRLGFYAQDLISLSEKVKIMAGLRWSYQRASTPTLYNLLSNTKTKATTASKADHAFSPRVGLVYQPLKTTAFFASYSNNFTVNSGIDVNDQALSPSLIDQYEVGVKNDFLDGRLSANLTVYKIVNNNLAQQAQFLKDGITENTNTNIKELTGQTTSDGVEVDLSGTLVDGLYFIGGYSYNFMRYTKTSGLKGSYVEGERLVSNPAHTANASMFYTFKTRSLKGMRIGFSSYYMGSRNAGWNNTVGQAQTGSRLIPLSGFATYDLSVGYTNSSFSILAKISNLTNELNYYVHENYSVNPIPPRQFLTTLTFSF